MSKRKHKDPLLVALASGHSFTWVVPDGGDMASMRGVIKHGQTLTMSPIVNQQEVKVGDIVLAKWPGGTILHLVGDIQDERFLIVNAMGKVNGWVGGSDLLGRVTHVIEPAARPTVPDMIQQLATVYQQIVNSQKVADLDAQRLHTIIADLHWYAERIGAADWDTLPRANQWSFAQDLWRLTKQATAWSEVGSAESINHLIDQGKKCVGEAAEIASVFVSQKKE